MSFSGRVLAAAKTNYIGMVVRVAGQLVAQIVLMRLLGPQVVGTFGYALLLNGVLALLIDQGFGWSLVQGDFDREEVAVVFSRLMLAGSLTAVVVFVASYPIERWLANPLAGQVIRWSAPAYLLIGPYAITHAKLRRDLRFQELQYATTGAYMVAYPGLGLVLALLDFGVWSLLGAWYAAAVLQIVIGHYYAGHSLRLTWPWRSCRAGPLGRQVAGINVLNWAVDNSSGVFVGGMGAHALGSFNAASMLGRQPALQLAQMLQVLLFSAASVMDHSAAHVRQLYLTALTAVALAVAPVYGLFYAHAEFLTLLMFGPKWTLAADALAAMCLGMAAMALSMVTSSVLTAKGGQASVIRSQALALVLLVAGLAWAASKSLETVAWVLSTAYALRLAYQLSSVVHSRAVRWQDIGGALRGPVALALLMALPVAGWINPAKPQSAHALAFAAQLATACALLYAMPRFFLTSECLDLLGRNALGRRLMAALRIARPNF